MQIVQKYREHPVAEVAVVAPNNIADDDLHAKLDSKVQMGAVFYVQSAMDDFATLNRDQIGKIIMEIALLGQEGLQINNSVSDTGFRPRAEIIPGFS